MKLLNRILEHFRKTPSVDQKTPPTVPAFTTYKSAETMHQRPARLSDKIKEDLLSRIGPKITHCTAAQNVPYIQAHGLHSAAHLARLANIDPQSLLLRNERPLLDQGKFKARLNDQKPLLAGAKSAATTLNGHTLKSWAAQLDERIFFWPGHADDAFAKSVDNTVQLKTLVLETAGFLDLLGDHLYICPINSGAFVRKPAKRGNWIYVPARSGWQAYRQNRTEKGLIKSFDTKIKELSLTCSISSEQMDKLILDII